MGDGRGRGRGVEKGGVIEEKIIYTITCTYSVIEVATSPSTTVKPEVDYQGAALQHLLDKVKNLKTQK